MTSKPITDGAKTDRRNQNMPEKDVAKAPIEPGMASRDISYASPPTPAMTSTRLVQSCSKRKPRRSPARSSAAAR